MLTLHQVLNGRTPLRCECGEDLFVEEREVDNGGATGRFVECKCGSSKDIHVPPGSVLAGIEGAPFMTVWGPVSTR